MLEKNYRIIIFDDFIKIFRLFSYKENLRNEKNR
jgi:hypothetical protein